MKNSVVRATTIRENNISLLWLLSSFVLLFSLLTSSTTFATIETSELTNLTINLVDGTKDDAPMANTRIDIKELLSDGTKKWRKRVTTDDEGKAAVSLEDLGTGKIYLLYARSTFNNRTKTLQIETAGTHTFRVGTPLLNITLRDAESGNVIVDKRVTAVQVETGEKDKWLARANSDKNGKLTLDIPAFSEGAIVQLRADKVYNKINAYSPLISKAGNLDFLIGDVRVKVIDVETGEPLANQVVTIYTKPAEGKNRWYSKATTDSSGLLRLNLKGVDTNSTNPPNYVLKTKSPFNKKNKYSQIINQIGDHVFTVGTPLLNVTLRDAKNGNIIPDARVTAVKIESGKKDKWLARTNSDENGKLSFDIPSLSEGATVQLRAEKIYNKINAYSPLISSAGKIDFLLGDVRIKVLDIRNDQPLPNQVVTIYTKPAEGKNRWYGKAITDSNGLLRLNLKGVDANSSNSPNYVLKIRSPFNKKNKYSQVINKVGEHVFKVGTPFLNVTLKDASNGSTPIVNKEIRAYRIVDGKRKGVARATTNAQGFAEFDIPELTEEGTVVSLRTKVFNTGMWAQSQDITSSGEVDFAIGTTVITIKDGSVVNGGILPGLKVNLREVISAEKTKGVANLVTDAQGKLRLTLPLLEKGKSYVLRTKNPNPNINQNKYSQVINRAGNHEFIVGTELLKITLVDATSKAPLAEKRIDVYQDRGSEKAKWLGKVTTDVQGKGAVDIPMLAEEGKTFFLRARQPYDAGNVYSQKLMSDTFAMTFPVGKTPVILSDKDSGMPITGQRIDAYEKLTTGKLKWRAKGNTDATGTVHFDLAQLELGNTHVFRTKNPFGQGKRFYSTLVMAQGPVAFVISVDEDSPLDLKAPVTSITSPAMGSDVGETGFELIGTATDNEAVDQVTITLNDDTSSTTHIASYDSGTHTWRFNVAAEHVTAGTTLQVGVTATDKAQNENTVTASYKVIADTTAPTISITSPSGDDDVPSTGFILNGIVTDDTGVTSLYAQVQDSSLGSVVDREVDVSVNGNWALAINNGQLTEGGSVVITLTATDVANRQTVVTMNLNVVAVNNEARHMINRITFGATAGLLDEIRSNGVTSFLNTQLAPNTIDDSSLDAILADNGEPFSSEELQVYQLTHMIHSRRQLREVMAWFWENHFNTDVNKDGNGFSYELAEHDAFRANALGNFRTLLDISAKSPAMLIYLDSILNVRSDANENYAREVMELSTCGVDGCYTQDDVEALAEILTGWQVQNDAFFFNASDHTPGSKVFQGVTITENGVEEGNTALDMLANHSATANYICFKLIEVFVSDMPNPGLNARCASTFQASVNDSDQITQVLRSLLMSPEFNSNANFNGKIKSPVEFAVGITRSMNAHGSYDNLSGYIRRMGLQLFQNPVPTGWDEVGSTWINSALLQERTRFVNQLVRASSSSATYIDPVAFFQSQNLETAEGIVAYLLDLLGGDIWDGLERQIALDILNENGAFDINAETADAQLRELIGTVLSYPEYNYQ